jgi:hypothetical protein
MKYYTLVMEPGDSNNTVFYSKEQQQEVRVGIAMQMCDYLPSETIPLCCGSKVV